MLIEELFPIWAAEQVAPRGCEVSMLRDFQDQTTGSAA